MQPPGDANIGVLTSTKRLRIWQQNVNKSNDGTQDLLKKLGEEEQKFDIVAIQEPYIDRGGNTRANQTWRAIRPTGYRDHQTKSRAVTLISAAIDTNTYTSIPINSQDIVGIQMHGDYGTIRIINIYNPCERNSSLDVLKEYLRSPISREIPQAPLQYIWLGDFNRHHPLWDEERNSHLFSTNALDLTQPLLDLLATYSMKMALPKDLPTLASIGPSKNWTRPDNVFCSDTLLDAFITCTTEPGKRPVKADHMPITCTIDISVDIKNFEPRRNYRQTDWEKFSLDLGDRLSKIPAPKRIETIAEFDAALKAMEGAVQATTEEHVPMTRPCPYSKRWWTKKLSRMKDATENLARQSYRKRGEMLDPIHEQYRKARNDYAQQIRVTKTEHWVEWLENLNETTIWTASRLVTGPSSDGGKARVPDLQTKDPRTGKILEEARDNEKKSELFFKAFFPPKPPDAAVPTPETTYPPPKWTFRTVTDKQIHRAIQKMKPYKASRPGTIPNSVFVHCRLLLVDYLGPLYRATDNLAYYPERWKVTETPVLRKPGKADYTVPNAWRPIVLSDGCARLLNSAKTEDIVTNIERCRILPENHFGGLPGRATTDSIHLLVHTVKHAWRNKRVASALFLDVKGAFPSTSIEKLIHEMRMRGIPKEYTQWLTRRLDGRTTVLSFDDYKSERFAIDNGLDQGDPLSLICYLLYNAGLLGIPRIHHGEMGLLYVDDAAIIATGKTFQETHGKLINMMERTGGILEWAADHNCEFGLDKFQLLDFTQKTEPHPLLRGKTRPILTGHIHVNGHKIEAKTSVKFLGVHIDQALRWKAHCAVAVARGHDWMIQFGRLARASSGVASHHLRKAYLAICVPRMLYAADIFLTPVKRGAPDSMEEKDERAIVKKLASIQRKVAISITGAMRTTAGDLLDAHANILPMKLLIDKHRHRAALRLATLPSTHPLNKIVAKAAETHVKSHPTPIHSLIHTYGIDPKAIEKIQSVRRDNKWESKMEINIESSKDLAAAQDWNDNTRIKIYTDGSGIGGMIGAAAVLYKDGRLKRTLRHQLGREEHHTVYEGEGVGMILGMELLRKEAGGSAKEVRFGVDNQAAIKATRNNKPTPSHHIWDLLEERQKMVERRHPRVSFEICWTPGHMGIEGNERADQEAKKAAQDGSSPDKDLPAPLRKGLRWSKSAIKQQYHKRLNEAAKASWKRSTRHGRMKRYDNTLPSNNFMALTKSLSRKNSSLILQLRTGHVPLNKHLHRIQKAESAICPRCHQYRETVHHYLIACPAYRTARETLRRAGGTKTKDMFSLLSDKKLIPLLLQYIASTDRFQSVYGTIIPPKIKKPEKPVQWNPGQ